MRKGKREPGRDPHGRLPDVDLLVACDELENGAAFSAIAEAAPGVVADVDDELLVVAAVMNRAAGAHGVAGAFELAQPSVMIQDHDDGNASLKEFVVHEDVVVLAQSQRSVLEVLNPIRSVRSRYTLSNRAKLLICVAVTAARA